MIRRRTKMCGDGGGGAHIDFAAIACEMFLIDTRREGFFNASSLRAKRQSRGHSARTMHATTARHPRTVIRVSHSRTVNGWTTTCATYE